MAEKLDRSAAMLCFLSGLVLGSVITMLVVPQSGAETRSYLSQRARDAERKVHEVQERADILLGQGRKTIRDKKDQLDAAIKAFRRAA